MELYHGALGGDTSQSFEVALAHALVRRASDGAAGSALRVYRPTTPTVAFGRRDTLRPGFPEAVALVRDAGFTPVVRAPGGRAVAYTSEALVVDHIAAEADSLAGMEQRFDGYARMWAGLLAEYGVDARIGAVPGEYCPGAHSVNARGRVKLVGTAQRILRRAWLFSAVAVFDGAEVLRPLLTEVYRALGLDFDGDSVGSVRDEAPEVDLDTFESGLLDVYEDRFGLTRASLDEASLKVARELDDDHRL